jgi:hypothetical protein
MAGLRPIFRDSDNGLRPFANIRARQTPQALELSPPFPQAIYDQRAREGDHAHWEYPRLIEIAVA